MLPTLIQRSIKDERLTDILQAVSRHVYDRINTRYQFIKSFLDNKMSIFEEYEAFKPYIRQTCIGCLQSMGDELSSYILTLLLFQEFQEAVVIDLKALPFTANQII